MFVITRPSRALVLALLPAWYGGAKLGAQTTAATPAASSYGHAMPAPIALAAPRTSPIVLDAKLDEPAWKTATPISDFTQLDPDEGKPASQRTEVRFLFDDDALY